MWHRHTLWKLKCVFVCSNAGRESRAPTLWNRHFIYQFQFELVWFFLHLSLLVVLSDTALLQGRDLFIRIKTATYCHEFLLRAFHHVTTCVIMYNVTTSVLRPKLCNRTGLTQLPLDKMTAISQTMFSGAFSWMKIFVFRLKFHWSLFLMGLIDNILALV